MNDDLAVFLLSVFLIVFGLTLLYRAFKQRKMLFCPRCKTENNYLTISINKKERICETCADKEWKKLK